MNPMTRPVVQQELLSLQRKRAEAIKAAGTKWLLHPANYVKRKPQKHSARPLLVLFALFLIAHIGNDCDGRCPQTTEISE